MGRDPNIPDAFDVYTVVTLRRPDDAPSLSDREIDELQARHLAYRAELARRGVLVVNGPLMRQSDERCRGISIFACDLAEAARLTDADPSVVAGWLAYDVMEWWVTAGSLAFPFAAGSVGERRSLPQY
ncbi:YciI family protein [Rathayibacter sp. YIM 133350]|uniref:YciI family protein n=1 Tax=Rathayibacter sp. YIM 133350 TaxID=3131992 RepID=UPI00307F75C1